MYDFFDTVMCVNRETRDPWEKMDSQEIQWETLLNIDAYSVTYA